MKKPIQSVFAMLLLALFTLSASANSNVMQLHDVTASPGDVITVELEVINDDPFNAFQLDIPLPEGFTYILNSAQLNPDRANNHLISSSVLGSGTLRLIGYHLTNVNFLGNEGVIATFQLQTPNVPGVHALNITNALLSGAGGNILTGTIPGTVTLTGDLPQATLTMSFNGNGTATVNGNAYTGPVSVNQGSTLEIDAIADPEWEFENWSGDLTGDTTPQTILMDDDKNVTANFSEIEVDPIEYTLTINIIGEGMVTVNGDHYTEPIDLEEGTTVLLEAAALEGWEFVEWSGSIAGSEPIISVTMDDHKTIHANFAEIPIIYYDITASAGPNGTIQPEGLVEVEEGEDQTFTITPDDHYHIYEIVVDDSAINLEDDPAWDANAGTYTFANVQQDHSIHATFAIDTYNLLYLPGENGTLDGETEQVVEHGQNGSPVLAVPDEGYAFTGWDDGVTDNPRTDENVTEDITVTALFEMVDYTLTVNISPEDAGSVDVVPDQEFYNIGDEITLTATPAEGYEFQNWRLDGVVIGESNVLVFQMPGDDVALEAFFVEEDVPLYDITLTANPAEGGTLAGGGSFLAGEMITVTAQEATGYKFVGWREGNTFVSFDKAYSFEVNKDRNLVANFSLKRHTVTLFTIPESNAGGGVSGGGTFNWGAEITVRASANKGFTFMGWFEDEELVSDNKEYTFTVTADHQLIAHFIGNYHEITITADPIEGGTVSGSGNYWEGEVVTAEAEPATGYFFLRWMDDDLGQVSLQNPYMFSARSDRNLTAEFWGPMPGLAEQQPLDEDMVLVTASVHPEGSGLIFGEGFNPITGEGNYTVGTEVTLTASPNAGIDFIHWVEGDEMAGTDLSYTFTATEDVDLIAVFDGDTYTISVEADPETGGNPTVSDDGEFFLGEFAQVNANVNPGYQFVNWTENDEQVSVLPDYGFTVTESLHLVANFEALDEFLLTLLVDPEGAGTVTGGGSFEEGTEVTIVAEANEGYTFSYWGVDNDIFSEDHQETFLLEEDMTLVAYFETNEYELTLVANPTEGGDVTGAGTYNFGDLVDVDAIPNEGWEFVNWTDVDGNEVSDQPDNTIPMPSSDLTLTANFVMIDYTLILIANPTEGGDVTGAGTYNFGDLVDVDAIPNEGWEFVNWTDVDDNEVSDQSDNTIPMPSSDLTLTANFVMIDYTLTLVANPTEGGDVTGAGTYNFGDLVDVDAIPNEGWAFVNWTDVDGNEVSDQPDNTIPMPSSDLTLTANFEMIDYTLTLVANPTEGGDVTGAGTYNFGDLVDVDAIPNEGWAFVNWTDVDGNEVSDQPDNTITMPATDLTLTANFEMIDYTLTLVANPTEGGDVTGAGTYNFGDQVDVDAIPNEGWAFVEWTDGDGNFVSDAPDNTITMPAGDVTLIAHFELLTYTLTFIVQDATTGAAITDAVITLNGVDYGAGEYVFEGLLPDTYIYGITADGYFVHDGEVSIVDQDMEVLAEMLIDDTFTDEVETTVHVVVFPNPASSVIHVEADRKITGLRLTDLLGKTVLFDQAGYNRVSLDVGGLRSGIYFLQVTTGGGEQVVRIQVID